MKKSCLPYHILQRIARFDPSLLLSYLLKDWNYLNYGDYDFNWGVIAPDVVLWLAARGFCDLNDWAEIFIAAKNGWSLEFREKLLNLESLKDADESGWSMPSKCHTYWSKYLSRYSLKDWLCGSQRSERRIFAQACLGCVICVTVCR